MWRIMMVRSVVRLMPGVIVALVIVAFFSDVAPTWVWMVLGAWYLAGYLATEGWYGFVVLAMLFTALAISDVTVVPDTFPAWGVIVLGTLVVSGLWAHGGSD